MQKFSYLVIDSTQEEAKRLIRAGLIEESSYLISEEQTQGRGQHGKSWASPKAAGIYLSIVAPIKNFELQGLIETYTIRVAEKIIQLLKQKYSYDFYIKPINDIYYDGKKLAGILVELLEHNSNHYLITGIGINCSQSSLQIKEKLIEQPKAVPISLEEILTQEEFSFFDKSVFISVLADSIVKI